ncbi:hypothetical protein J3R83DRAFT_4609 [Lanmaoa asiatica]|nr:hypothetical protein J3R83DRAFT_4609 [Lanmaoa asiatica]
MSIKFISLPRITSKRFHVAWTPHLYLAAERGKRDPGHRSLIFTLTSLQSTVNVLAMQPRLRAAVLQGGVLGRIYSPYISLNEVAEGPSPDALRYGLRWQAQDTDLVYVENFISEDEIHLLSQSSGRVGQFKAFSIFPMPDHWEKSGIHTEMWSNSAEKKFRSTIRKLNPPHPHDSQPQYVPGKMSADWKSHLRPHIKQTRKFLTYVEKQAIEFLTSL